MNDLSSEIKTAINEKFGTVSDFCRYIGVSQSTVATALKNGVDGMRFETVIKILSALGLEYSDGIVALPGKNYTELANKFSRLDERGKEKMVAFVSSEVGDGSDDGLE